MQQLRLRGASKGMQLIHLAGLAILIIMASALTIDFGYYFAAQNQLQTSTDASALAAASELYRSNAVDSSLRREDAQAQAEDFVEKNQPSLTLDNTDITFGFVDPVTKIYNPADYNSVSTDPVYALTGGMNAARIRLLRTEGSSNGPLNTIMANTLGINKMATGAYSVAFLDRGIGSVTAGLRPVYACEPQVDKALEDGIAENNAIRVYGDRLLVDGDSPTGCPQPGTGNWGFADLRNCDPDAPGATDTASWFDQGFDGTVNTGECYSTQSGNFLSNHNVEEALDKLIANKTVISIPVYDSYSGGGSNTQVDISGFAGFVITGYKSTGPSNGRYIDGYFTKSICTTECTSSDDGSGSGGIMVKLRMAYQN